MPHETPTRVPPDAAAERISARLAECLGPHKFDMWFGRTILQVKDRQLEVATDSPFVAKWIGTNFASDLQGIVRENLGGEAKVAVRVAPELFAGRHARGDAPDDDAARGEGVDLAGRPARGGDGPASWPRRSVPTAGSGHRSAHRRGPGLRRLEEYVVGQYNRLAFSAACRLIDEPDGSISPLFVHGECGIGKTHLLQGICRRFREATNRRGRVRYVTGEQFTNEFIAAVRSGKIEPFRREIRGLDLLAIDDVHFLSNKMRTQSEFLHTLDAINLTGARIVLASDAHPQLIRRFPRALISRLLSGMVVRIERPDRETRIEIVRRLAAARRLPIHDLAAEAVASRFVGSVRELQGAVTKLAAMRSLESVEGSVNGSPNGTRPQVGLVLVERLFNDHGLKPPTPVRIATVIDVVAMRLGITRADLMGSSRHRRVVLGRAIVSYLGRDMTTHSYPELARALGRTYHSTIHTAEQRLRRQMDENKTVVLEGAQRPLAVTELVDQLRHEITRITART